MPKIHTSISLAIFIIALILVFADIGRDFLLFAAITFLACDITSLSLNKARPKREFIIKALD